jgi:hypothetical protein
VASCCKCSDKPFGSWATDLVSYILIYPFIAYTVTINMYIINSFFVTVMHNGIKRYQGRAIASKLMGQKHASSENPSHQGRVRGILQFWHNTAGSWQF